MNNLSPNLILIESRKVKVFKEKDVLRLLVNNTVYPPSKIKKFEIQCGECSSFVSRKSLTKKLMLVPYLCQSCCKKGERNGFYGKSHSSEFKSRLSNERKGSWCVGENNPMYGINVWNYVSPEKASIMREKNRQDTLSRDWHPFKNMKEHLSEEKWKEAHRKRIETVNSFSQERKAEISKKLSIAQKRIFEKDPELYIENKKRAARASAHSNSKYKKNNLEIKVEDWLINKGFDPIYSAIMSDGSFTYQFDFLLRQERILIECHGSYWHADERLYDHQKLNNTQLKNIERDKRKEKFAQDKKFELIIIWEEDVKNNDFSALEVLL